MDINEFRINLVFTIEEMNMIFKILGSAPYDDVARLIENVKDQVDKQLVPPESFEGNETEHPL